MIFRFLAGTAFVTRPSAIFQGLLVGLFLQGAGRWGFDSILETVEQLIGDGTFGTSLPVFLTNSTTFAAAATQGVISWMSIEDAAVSSEGWDGYSLLVDDVVAQTGSATNFSIAALNTSLPHFFRYVALFFARVFKGTITYSTHFSHFADSPILKLELPETLRKPLPPSSSTLLGLIPLQELLDSSQLGSNFRLFVLFSLFDWFLILFICCLYSLHHLYPLFVLQLESFTSQVCFIESCEMTLSSQFLNSALLPQISMPLPPNSFANVSAPPQRQQAVWDDWESVSFFYSTPARSFSVHTALVLLLGLRGG